MAASTVTSQPQPFHIERYAPGQGVRLASMQDSERLSAATPSPVARPGDFILTHSVGFIGSLIRFGEWLRYWGENKVFAHWSHAAIFVDSEGTIIEALGGGVQKRNISVYRDTEYVVVFLPDDTTQQDREEAVRFAEFSLNDPYGYLTIISISLSLLTTAKFSFGIDGQQICSALVARCLERIGEIFEENEPWHLMPADLAKHFNVQLTGDKGRAPAAETGVVAFSKPGRRKR
jgi:uncharacterized protein YycO